MPTKPLTDQQEEQIRACSAGLSVPDLARAVGAAPGRVYRFIYRHRLPFRRLKPATKHRDTVVGEGFFNTRDQKNWLV